MPRWIFGMIRRDNQRRPRRVRRSGVVAIGAAQRDGRDRPPEDVSVFGMPAADDRVGYRDVHSGENVGLLQQGKVVSLRNLDGGPIPEPGGVAGPESAKESLVRG